MVKLLICDLDGCLIDSEWIWDIIRQHKFSEAETWDFFNRNANSIINKIDKCLVNYLAFKISGGLKVLFLTARSQAIETETINFIQKRTGLIYVQHFSVSFRSLNDDSVSVESKRLRLEALLLSGQEIELAIDDEKAICEMYRSKGIKAYHWAIGSLPVDMILQYGEQLKYLTGKEEFVCLN